MSDWTDFAVSGVTKDTPRNIMLGAGTLYKDLVYISETSKWTGTILGATSGGTKLSIVPEVANIEVDGVTVKAKGLAHKVGETASIETNMIELTKEWIASTTIGTVGISEDERFDVIESSEHIADSNYIENFGYVGFMTDGTPVVVVFDYALCTTGLEAEGKNKEAAVLPATFECYADLAEGNEVALAGFGKFVVKTRAARESINPRSKEVVKVPACKAVTYKPSKNIKEAVNK